MNPQIFFKTKLAFSCSMLNAHSPHCQKCDEVSDLVEFLEAGLDGMAVMNCYHSFFELLPRLFLVIFREKRFFYSKKRNKINYPAVTKYAKS